MNLTQCRCRFLSKPCSYIKDILARWYWVSTSVYHTSVRCPKVLNETCMRKMYYLSYIHKPTNAHSKVSTMIISSKPVIFFGWQPLRPTCISLYSILVTPDLMQWCSPSDAVETWKRTKHLSLWRFFMHKTGEKKPYPTLIEHQKPSYIIWFSGVHMCACCIFSTLEVPRRKFCSFCPWFLWESGSAWELAKVWEMYNEYQRMACFSRICFVVIL